MTSVNTKLSKTASKIMCNRIKHKLFIIKYSVKMCVKTFNIVDSIVKLKNKY